MRAHLALAACAALAAMSPPNDQGGPDLLSGQGGDPGPGQTEADAQAAAAAQAEADAAAAAAQAEADARAAAEAAAAKAPKTPKEPKAAKPKAAPPVAASTAQADPDEAGNVAMIWVQPGHERFAVGEMIYSPAEDAEGLRSAGRARHATADEVKARVG